MQYNDPTFQQVFDYFTSSNRPVIMPNADIDPEFIRYIMSFIPQHFMEMMHNWIANENARALPPAPPLPED